MYMPHDRKPQCDFISCFYGMGLAGHGQCPGLWWWASCPEYEDEEVSLARWEDEDMREYDEDRRDR